VDKQIFDVLVCPACKSEVEETGDGIRCRNAACARVYPVRDGVPIMLLSEATAGTGDSGSEGQ
jgi:uncharacterized protein